ncbi:endonuclease/exonuclease/phosphatase family protein [Agrobacterium sp. rho-13.3]|uniref:endonuclease/exonuclease/phosphatase family protein n=1 Tax=Agrobacterium sp. rho-13.3 TaxID=3072980 RepID=UPI002A16E0E2|nr:endonuclease/exonuclease/phosphatase family protein [Agrobacterium sp. rho-13.3]MDX8308609.1 endonuclease/exonuclease/phosphatase family protein [Agrobacterium sp. rho-13.3]
MRILSLNAWGGTFHHEMVAYLKDVDPDVICLQEVIRSEKRLSDWLVYRDHGVELQQRGNMFEELRAAFPQHDIHFCQSMRGELYDGDAPVWTGFGLATLVRRSYAVIGQAMDFVHGDFSAHGWGDHPRSRHAHVLRLFGIEDSRTIVVAHMHGLRIPSGKQDNPERLAQAQALRGLIEGVRRPNERIVACGDFNVLPFSATFEILGTLGLTDLVTTRGFTDTRTSHYSKPERYADYMLVTPNVDVAHFDVVKEPEVSDHRALLLDIR